MAADRYVLLGLARPRAEWFRQVSQWSTSAAVPVEFLRCVSVEEVRAQLASGRPFSAVLLDGGLPSVDRDLIESARQEGCHVVLVDDGRGTSDLARAMSTAVLPVDFTREQLLDALVPARRLGQGALDELSSEPEGGVPGETLGNVAVVCGPGGTGASTVAAALAQGLGHDGEARWAAGVVLVDLALHAEQAMLHDVRDVVPGVQELVEAHRSRHPSGDEVRSFTFAVIERRYHLLLGLRRARYWATLRPRALEVAFRSLQRTYAAVVCDVTADFEGEDDTGAAEVEERNLMARTALAAADVTFAVGRPGVKGLHSLVRVLADLASAGVPPERVVPVINAAPRHPRARAELVAALAELAGPAPGGRATVAPVFLPRRRVEEALRDAVRLPPPLPGALAGAFAAVLAREGRAPSPVPNEPARVTPGSIGSWSPEAL